MRKLLLAAGLTILSPLLASIAPPQAWQSRIDSHNMFFAEDDSVPGLYLPVIGNGYLAHQIGDQSLYVAGVYNNETTSPAHRARIPPVLNIQINSARAGDSVSQLGAAFDIQRAAYFRRSQLTAGGEVSGWFEQRWYAHRELRSVYVMELEVHPAPGKTMQLELTSNTGAPSVDIMFKEVAADARQGAPQDVSVIYGKTTIPETPETPLIEVAVAQSVVPKVLSATHSQTFAFVTAVRSSVPDRVPWDGIGAANVPAPVPAAIADYNEAQLRFVKGTLFSSHVDSWAQLWKAGFEIDGRPDVATAVNASFFAVLAGVRSDWVHGLAPGGLTQGYNGHSFWDTETWMYPALLMWHPEIALSLMHYRYDRIPGARLKAASYNPPYQGAMFSWESSLTGVETCPDWAPTGLREVHISGDIAFAAWQYWRATRDIQWLKEEGYPMLRDIAIFWQSRLELDADGVAHIRGVIPPDEYVEWVDDSVYTNYVAVLSFRFATEAATIVGENPDPEWTKLANAMLIVFDETRGIHPEYAGYPGQVIKQADVVLLPYPLEMPMPDEVRKNDLEYYSARTDAHGPAMTWGMHMIGYRDIGEYDLADKFFDMAFRDNMHAPFQMWTETPDGNAINFITGAGGFLQTVIFGWPGLRLEDNRLSFSALCPRDTNSYKLRSVSYRGATFDLSVSCAQQKWIVDSVTIDLKSVGTTSLRVEYTPIDDTESVINLTVAHPLKLSFDASLEQPARFRLAPVA